MTPGMAHFAGTGPIGAFCHQCKFFDGTEKAGKCAKYRRLMGGQAGPKFAGSTQSCKYFERKG